jgi:pectin methylesterase-like acyl-CoA thioesterase
MLFSKKTRVMLTISAALYLAVMSLPCLGQTVAVGTCLKSLPSFSTIQDAVNTVPSLGTVKVCPGNYPEQVIISKPLTLTGISSGTSDMPAVIAPAGGSASTSAPSGRRSW